MLDFLSRSFGGFREEIGKSTGAWLAWLAWLWLWCWCCWKWWSNCFPFSIVGWCLITIANAWWLIFLQCCNMDLWMIDFHGFIFGCILWFLKMVDPQNNGFQFQYWLNTWWIWGYPHFRKPPWIHWVDMRNWQQYRQGTIGVDVCPFPSCHFENHWGLLKGASIKVFVMIYYLH